MKHTHQISILPEKPGRGRLGRHIEHDPSSRAFAIVDATHIASQVWQRHCDPFDQGDLGSCTGNAMAGLLMTGPFFRPERILDEDAAVSLYEAATALDRIPGTYPPDDTGSSGLAVAKAAERAGFIPGYSHAFSLHGLLSGLQHGPVIVGMSWYEGFDAPTSTHELVIAGGVRGGHEFELLAVDVSSRLVRICNSWGTCWGDHGYAVMSYDTLDRLLGEGGDCTIPHQ